MTGRLVVADDGSRWRVKRRWWRRPRWRRIGGPVDAFDVALQGGFEAIDDVGGLFASIAIGLAIALATIVLIVVAVPLVLFVGELLALPFLILLARGPLELVATNEATGEVRRFGGRRWRSGRGLGRLLASKELGADALRVG